MNYIIKNGYILDENNKEVFVDIRVQDGVIKEMGTNLEVNGENIYEANGCLIAPGFIDLHIHLREPGGEHKETIETGTMAAAKGGYTTVACMPNTKPVPDTPEQMEWLMNRINESGHVKVLPYASITIGQLGEELTNFSGLKEKGAFAFTDDGVGIQTAGMMFEAMKRAAAINMAVVAHCEDNSLIYGGAVHEGEFSKKYGVPGIPSVCESVHIARDILLAEATGCHYHVCHISTKESVRVVRDAKKAGINVTAEVTPHHLLLCEDDIPGIDTNYKMNPPLRSKEDRDALIEGLLDGTIDFIATDHAPHTSEEKGKGMEHAPFGIVGLETAFPLLYTHFVEKGIFTLKQLIDWLTIAPAKAFQLTSGKLEVGAAADITVINLEQKEEINHLEFKSKGKNTPFSGWNCKGWPIATFVDGKLKWNAGGAQ
ncbi:dihydroorotase [Heyndrickxia oleronia]|jgi:dihydroorotase|uniref:Dihydroorotase n=1 Tax=Heyndrickxia oleronia TaxID=38875 RepID=A0A8E2I9Q8_9BACI|nr:dihydroorotase [Heyndrickxia oleronia]MCI1589688.1 dihydroorotase [Heyndrickxia oleronia]MCI1615544.1 dihydroorotase [Heyndrickxia oleronia]MCI1746239.1 dihydroorotase [Heyndrickxia oleronia]MCI1763845.1 dihydroorotase [Heyndrickxia oleronia]MCM3454251.1 dihydroorotase [Heyndrickxia oleronia]